MEAEHDPPEQPVRRRPGCRLAIMAAIVAIIGFVIWVDGAFPTCGPETANDTAGFCQGPSRVNTSP